jgi:hypothetical protein
MATSGEQLEEGAVFGATSAQDQVELGWEVVVDGVKQVGE